MMAESPESAAEVVALSGNPNPTVLYLGTASYDDPHNARIDTESYSALGCSIGTLNVSWTAPSESDVRSAFDDADIILIAGGNTLFAVDRWTNLGIDVMIRSAVLDRHVVVAGGSAGFIALCNGGHSDSMKPESYKNPVGPVLNPSANVRDVVDASWEYIRVPGLGIIDALCCPHYDTTQNNGVSRADDFTNMMRRHSGEYGIAVDEWAALVIDGDSYRVVSRLNHTGSVGPRDAFATNSSGTPGIWSLSVDGGVGEVKRTLVPTEGKVADIIHSPRWVVDDPMVLVARAHNPDDGRPAAWTQEQHAGLQPHHYVFIVAIFGIVGAIVSLYQRTRVIAQRYEQVLARDWEDPEEST